MQQQAPPTAIPLMPAAPVVPPPPLVIVPDVVQAEDGLLKQFLSLHAPFFSGATDEDPTKFLRQMETQFRLMAYDGPRRVEIAEFMLKGPTQSWFDLITRNRLVGEVFTWDDF